MANDEDYFFPKSCLVRELPESALNTIGLGLMSDIPDRNWCALGGHIGYSVLELDKFRVSGPKAGYNLLKDWGYKESSTLHVMERSLEHIGRLDLVESLNDIRKNPIKLYVTIQSEGGIVSASKHIDVNVKGRKELWKGMIDNLEEHALYENQGFNFTCFELVRPHLQSFSWLNDCSRYMGQEILLKTTFSNVTNNERPLRQLASNCDLIGDTMLRLRARCIAASENNVTVNAECNNDISVTSHDWETGSYLDLRSTAGDLDECETIHENNTMISGMENGLNSLNLASDAQPPTLPVFNNSPMQSIGCPPILMLRNDDRDGMEYPVEPVHNKTRRSHGIPDKATLAKQFPGIETLPGFHRKLRNRMKEIETIFDGYLEDNGAYVLRAFVSDPQTSFVQLAISVVFSKKIKHFLIVQNRQSIANDLSPRYFIFKNSYQASSLSQLLDYYTHHPLVPQMETVSNEYVTNLSRMLLERPILSYKSAF